MDSYALDAVIAGTQAGALPPPVGPLSIYGRVSSRWHRARASSAANTALVAHRTCAHRRLCRGSIAHKRARTGCCSLRLRPGLHL